MTTQARKADRLAYQKAYEATEVGRLVGVCYRLKCSLKRAVFPERAVFLKGRITDLDAQIVAAKVRRDGIRKESA